VSESVNNLERRLYKQMREEQLVFPSLPWKFSFLSLIAKWMIGIQ